MFTARSKSVGNFSFAGTAMVHDMLVPASHLVDRSYTFAETVLAALQEILFLGKLLYKIFFCNTAEFGQNFQ
jgi:hypothetical protein